MRAFTLLTALLPALALAANEQAPLGDRLKGWVKKATDGLQSAASHIPNPIDAGASKIAEEVVVPLNRTTWKSLVVPGLPKPGNKKAAPPTGPEEWMILVTGGNKTCFGLCGPSEKAWNESVALLQASNNPPRLATIDCETDPIMCNRWAFVGAPCIVHVLFPQAPLDQTTAYAPTVRSIPLNRTSVTASDIYEISRVSQSKYEDTEVYTGIFHPWTGFVNTNPVGEGLATFVYYLSKIPSFAFMILISFASRHFMRRMPGSGGAAAGAPPAAGAGAGPKKSK